MPAVNLRPPKMQNASLSFAAARRCFLVALAARRRFVFALASRARSQARTKPLSLLLVSAQANSFACSAAAHLTPHFTSATQANKFAHSFLLPRKPYFLSIVKLPANRIRPSVALTLIAVDRPLVAELDSGRYRRGSPCLKLVP